jgi:hypothetical protein
MIRGARTRPAIDCPRPIEDVGYLLTSMQRSLARLPGATSIGFHTGTLRLWNLLNIHASSDDAVRALSFKLGLGAPERVTADGRCWLHAGGSIRETRIVVSGPLEGVPDAPRAHACASVSGQLSR